MATVEQYFRVEAGCSKDLDSVMLLFSLAPIGRITAFRPVIEKALSRLGKPLLFVSQTLPDPGNLAELVPPNQPRFGRDRHRCGRPAARNTWPGPRPRPVAARFLELGSVDRRAGVGTRGHVVRIRRSAGWHQ